MQEQIKNMIDTSKQGIDHYLSLVLIKGYKIMLLLDDESKIKLKYIDTEGKSDILSGCSCADVIAELYNIIYGQQGENDKL